MKTRSRRSRRHSYSHKRKIRKSKTRKGGFSFPWDNKATKYAQKKIENFNQCNTIWKRQITNRKFCSALKKNFKNSLNQTPQQQEEFRNQKYQQYNANNAEDDTLQNNTVNEADEDDDDQLFSTPRQSVSDVNGIMGGKTTRRRRKIR